MSPFRLWTENRQSLIRPSRGDVSKGKGMAKAKVAGRLFQIVAASLLCLAGCGPQNIKTGIEERGAGEGLARTGYAIQVGAFAVLENAIRLTRVLREQGLDAYYYPQPRGLYKVRFGDFSCRKAAGDKAEYLLRSRVIEAYYIVKPGAPFANPVRGSDRAGLRSRIVATAECFLGIPYRWGGRSRDRGFDCSGLTMAVYSLNGLRLPRTAKRQYEAGRPIDSGVPQKGDLVFFSMGGGRDVSHVGLYVGGGRFIHAPGRGKTIRTDALSTVCFFESYLGARTFL